MDCEIGDIGCEIDGMDNGPPSEPSPPRDRPDSACSEEYSEPNRSAPGPPKSPRS